MERKWIVDTTLRDGEQSPGIVFSIEEKLEIVGLLDKSGVYEIELGIPNINIESYEYVQILKEKSIKSKLSLWSRMNTEDVKKAISYKPDILHIGVPVSYVQIYSKLKKNKTWVQKTMANCIELAMEKGISVTVGLEDASRSDEGFVVGIAKIFKGMGGNTVRIADTVGVLTPERSGTLVKNIYRETGLDLEFHAHNDLGMAVANSIEAAKSGAKYIDCTVLGIGERSGNCDFIKFLNACERIYDFGINKSEIKKIEKLISV